MVKISADIQNDVLRVFKKSNAHCFRVNICVHMDHAPDSAADETAAPTANCCARGNGEFEAPPLALPEPAPLLVPVLPLALIAWVDALSASAAVTHALPMRRISVASAFEKGATERERGQMSHSVHRGRHGRVVEYRICTCFLSIPNKSEYKQITRPQIIVV